MFLGAGRTNTGGGVLFAFTLVRVRDYQTNLNAFPLEAIPAGVRDARLRYAKVHGGASSLSKIDLSTADDRSL